MNKYNIFSIATGIGAKKFGAELGVWDLYYKLPSIINQNVSKVFHTDSQAKLLDVIPVIADLFEDVNKYVLENMSANNKFLCFTGDHSGAIGIWSSISNLIGPKEELGVIWVDAHLDLHTPETSASKSVHGMPVAHLLGLGDKRLSAIINKHIKPSNICFIGTRDYEQEEIDLVKKLGIKVIDMKEISSIGINQAFANAVDHVSKATTSFGISLDMDSMDPSEMPATGCFNPGGLHLSDVIRNLKIASHHESFIGLEITEYNPLLDIDNKTINGIKEILIECFTKEK